MIKRQIPSTYRERRRWLLNFLGGRCAKCGSSERLEADHIDPATKWFELLGRDWNCRWDLFVAEARKCQLLCRKHHIQKSILERGDRIAKGRHGTRSSYRYCKCEKCRAANAAYMRKLRSKGKQ